MDASKLQIILVKLEGLLENAPNPVTALTVFGVSPLSRWLASVAAVLKVYDSIQLGAAMSAATEIYGNEPLELYRSAETYILRAIEEIKIELELEGRSEFGNAYGPGEVYRYFADLKQIVGAATKELLIVDPYFNGEAFDSYLAGISNKVLVRLFFEHNSMEVSTFAGKHCEQYGSQIEVRSSKRLHDRVVFVDRDSCWISGGSIKDGGRKPTYLIPLSPGVAEKKQQIYEELWNRSKPIDFP